MKHIVGFSRLPVVAIAALAMAIWCAPAWAHGNPHDKHGSGNSGNSGNSGDPGGGSGNGPNNLNGKKFQTLEAQIVALQGQVTTLQGQVTALQSQVASLQSVVSSTAFQNALALGGFVTVDPHAENGLAGPNVIFHGANFHIESGSGTTVDSTGLGNLVIGYDEDSQNASAIDAARTGSHNLIVGPDHVFMASGGLVAGFGNASTANYSSVTGGACNDAGGMVTVSCPSMPALTGAQAASVSGGLLNVATGLESSASGGTTNNASGAQATVSGGSSNVASGAAASVGGGTGQTASGAAQNIN